MIHCVIFDLDGTLLNTLDDLRDSTNFALSKFGYPERTLSEIKTFVGNGVRLLIERAIPSGALNPDFEDCLEIFKAHYKENMFNKTIPYEGVLDMLNTLDLRGIQTAVVSNKFDIAVRDLCKKYFGDLIKIAVGENEEKGIRKKPFPDSVLRAVLELGVNTNNTIYVGDSETDIQTARNAGLRSVGCLWGYRSEKVLRDEGANYIINSPEEIIGLIDNL